MACMDAVTEALNAILPAHPLELQVEGQQFPIAQSWLYFQEHTGHPPKASLAKPVIGPPDRPFAELQVVKRLKDQGRTAGWQYRPGKFISIWEPRKDVQFPDSARALLARIEARAGNNASCSDVFSWQPEPLFIHLLRGSSENLSIGRLRWLEAAHAEGVLCLPSRCGDGSVWRSRGESCG
jgi:hypothetical protein